MKKLFIIAFAMCVMVLYTASAQTNLNFENWSSDEPVGWVSSNTITTANGGAQTAMKESTNPGQGSFSVKLLTGNCPDCPNFSIFGQFGPITPFPNPLGGSIQLGSFVSPGMPYSQRPISVDFKYKAKPMANDAGGFWVELTKYNTTSGETEKVGDAYFESGTEVTTWTNRNIPVVYYSNLIPDTMNILITSSIGSMPDLSAFGIPTPQLPKPVAGSEFYVDAIVFNMPSCAGFSITMTGTKETALGANDGTATATPNGGTAPYTYAWINLSNTQSISGLIPGYYYVTVTDANACQKVGNYFVAPGTCNLSVTVTGTNSSANSIYTGNGTAVLTASGGNPPYDILWNTGETTASVSNLPVGTYAVLVVEQNNANCAVWGYFTNWGPGGAPSGIRKPLVENTFSIEPNPVNGKLTLKMTNPENEISDLVIYNVLGEKIYSNTFTRHQTNYSFDISHLPKDLYFVKIYEGENVWIRKIVVQ